MRKSKKKVSVQTLFFIVSFVCVACVAVVFLLLPFFAAQPESPVSKLALSIGEDLLTRPIIKLATPTPKPTPLPYPPKGYHCVNVPILMYHHVEPLSQAQSEGHASLTVDSGIFASQMQYVKDKNYTPITLSDVAAYFDTGTSLPAKPIILTFDDGYVDFYTFALPTLSTHNFASELFVPTGLMENPGYLSWSQIAEAKSRGVTISHHTWSHANVAQTNDSFFAQELDVATKQLVEHGYGPVKIFAYPYGTNSKRAIQELAKRGFSIAVTTNPGRIQCKEDRLLLRRIRIGNGSLASYGL